MAKVVPSINAFNRGRISPLALGRVDLDRIALSAEIQTNWMPRTLGSMMLRPGLEYVTPTRNNGSAIARLIDFIYATDDTAVLEITDVRMRVLVDDELVTRVAVSTAITNGTFDTDLSGWTDADETGATSAWATGGYMSLTGTGYNAAIRRQEVTVSAGDQGVEHALRITVTRGQIVLRVGSSAGTEEYVEEMLLRPGVHSRAFVPTGNFWVQLENRSSAASILDSVEVEAAGVLEVPTPWSSEDRRKLRWTQSASVIFVACEGYQPRRIERWVDSRSWSVVLYEPEDGPFRIQNVGPTRITPSALSGDITLTASSPLFRSGHVGAIFRIASSGQKVDLAVTGEAQWTNEIRVTGVGTTRRFNIVVSGTWSGTVTMQRSIGEPGAWTDVLTWTGNVSTTHSDALDNQIIYYRIGIDAGDYTSGTANVSLEFSGGSRTGVVRITEVASSTSASAAVLTRLGGTGASEDWSEGEWSPLRGWPTAVVLHEGRLWWTGKGKVIGSVSDAYESFDDEIEGDSAAISRSIGEGPVDTINWAISSHRLLLGAPGAEWSARSSSFDEALTPTNFNLKSASTQGSAAVAAVKIDQRSFFVQRNGTRVYELGYKFEDNDFRALDMTALVPEVGEPSIVEMLVQRQPDTRVHCIRSDGTVAVLIFDAAENVVCWVDVETDGTIETGVVLPGDIEDRVYYVVRRVINGAVFRTHERWALESECRGDAVCKLADSSVTYTGAATTTIPVAHLVGETVVAWADGVDMGTFTVSSGGTITLPTAKTNVTVGLGYQARYKSTKLAYGANLGSALLQTKRLSHIGLLMADTHARGIQFGPDFDHLDDLPGVEDGAAVDADYIWSSYDKGLVVFPGTYDTDSRVCLQAAAPRPCTVLALVIGMETSEKA